MRVFLLADVVGQINAARAQSRNWLIPEYGSAFGAWSQYRATLKWWRYRTPMGFIAIAGFFKALGLLFTGAVAAWVSLLFVGAICLGVVSAVRLIAAARQEEPPIDWQAFESGYFGQPDQSSNG
jgi:hypothetical protein